MRRVLVCTFAAMALSVAPAATQTLPGNTGEFYAGLHGGYVQQGIDGVFQRNANPAHPDALPFDLSSLDSNGSLFGVHAGYDIPLAGIFPRGVFVGIVGEYSKFNQCHHPECGKSEEHRTTDSPCVANTSFASGFG